MENADKSLIDAHLEGDREAFAELVRRHGGIVLGYLRKMTGRPELAEDLFQETFKRVHEKAHTLRGSRFRPWLFKIATNVALDGIRRGSRSRMVSLDQEFGCAGNGNPRRDAAVAAADCCEPSQEAILAEQRRQVRQAIELLPRRQRATLVLAYYQQLSYREVAEAMGCSIGAVKTQMYRALRKLAQKLPDVSGGVR